MKAGPMQMATMAELLRRDAVVLEFAVDDFMTSPAYPVGAVLGFCSAQVGGEVPNGSPATF